MIFNGYNMNKNYDEKSIREKYKKITQDLISKGITITTMESATSGQIASLITDTEGASAIFKGSFVAYSNEIKIKLGVAEDIIEEYSVYSKQTARAMAQNCRKVFGADIGIGVTGTMGNRDSLNEEYSVPGCVYFSLSTSLCDKDFCVEIPPQPSRLLYKLAVADAIGDELIKLI